MTIAMYPINPPSGQRPGITHEDGGRIAVEPEESQAGASHGSGDDRHLVGGLQYGRSNSLAQTKVADDQSENTERETDDCHAPRGQAVQAVGEIDRVAGAGHDDRRDEDERSEIQRQAGPFEKRKIEGSAPRS